MKPALIALLIVGFVSGCSTLQDVANHLYGNSEGEGKIASAKPVKELTPEEQKRRDSVVGEYEQSWPDGTTHKLVFLQNGVREWYTNGKKQGNLKWKVKWTIVNGEIHLKLGGGFIRVWKINQDKNITWIAEIRDGKRKDYPKERQNTYKRISTQV